MSMRVEKTGRHVNEVTSYELSMEGMSRKIGIFLVSKVGTYLLKATTVVPM